MTDSRPTSDSTASARPAYPQAERTETTDHPHGIAIADPYQWLEDPSDERTREWSATQDELARGWLDALPGRTAIAETMRTLLNAGSVSVPLWRAGRAFFTRREPGQEFPTLHLRDHDGSERVLLDVTELDPTGNTTLDTWSPNRDGSRLAYQVSVGGNEESLLHVLDVDSGKVLEGPIDRCRYSPIGWLPSGEEFYYVRKLKDVPEGEESFHRRVWRHRIGTDPENDVLVHGEGLDPRFFFGVQVSEDGRWLVVQGSPGTARRDSIWIADLESPTPQLRQILDAAENIRATAWVERDGRLYIHTTWDAPRWRLCVADPASPERDHWAELVPEDPDAVLEAARLFTSDGRQPELAVLRTRHAVSEITLHDAISGTRTATVDLPGTGQVTALTTVDSQTDEQRERLWVGYTDFITPPCVHSYSRETGRTTLAEAAPGAGVAPDVRTEQVTYESRDGTTVRMFVLSPPGNTHRTRPALMTGYGGFSLSMEPSYTPSALAWVNAGGVWALPSLRGGAEEGEQWHRDGMRESKQNVFDDFHAAAEYLIEQGWTSKNQLAITGGSNGGLLVGAALTQRPELYRAVVCSAPLLDMARYERFLLGPAWADEYGTADDETELRWLLRYSPYHNIVESSSGESGGIAYPSTLFSVFESDSRVDPSHARKMCARLQHATVANPGEQPILLRRETEVGHSTRSVSRTVGLATDHLGFLAHATGLDLQ